MADRSPLGLLDTDSLIGEEDRAMQQTVRKWVDERVRPNIAEWYENGSTPVRDIAREMGALRLADARVLPRVPYAGVTRIVQSCLGPDACCSTRTSRDSAPRRPIFSATSVVVTVARHSHS